MDYYLIGKNDKFRLGESTILRIAWEAVARRRLESKKRGNKLRLNGTIEESGYAIYKDYEQYLEERKRREKLKLTNWDIMRVKHEIKRILESKGWTVSPHHPETRFYPPKLPEETAKL